MCNFSAPTPSQPSSQPSGVAAQAQADEIRLLWAAAMQTVFHMITDEFERTYGHKLIFAYTTMNAITERVMAGETPDLIVGSTRRSKVWRRKPHRPTSDRQPLREQLWRSVHAAERNFRLARRARPRHQPPACHPPPQAGRGGRAQFTSSCTKCTLRAWAETGAPHRLLADALARDFGSIDRWRREFMALANSLDGGAGWVLLSWVPRAGRLVNQTVSDGNQAIAGAIPILALDMYEHA